MKSFNGRVPGIDQAPSPPITKSRGHFRRIRADGLHEHTSVGNDRVNGRGHAVHHNVNEKARLRRRFAAHHPRPGYFAGRVVECSVTLTVSPESPTENFGVEIRRTLVVECGNLDVTNFAVCIRGGRQVSFGLLLLFPVFRPSPSIRLTASLVS